MCVCVRACARVCEGVGVVLKTGACSERKNWEGAQRVTRQLGPGCPKRSSASCWLKLGVALRLGWALHRWWGFWRRGWQSESQDPLYSLYGALVPIFSPQGHEDVTPSELLTLQPSPKTQQSRLSAIQGPTVVIAHGWSGTRAMSDGDMCVGKQPGVKNSKMKNMKWYTVSTCLLHPPGSRQIVKPRYSAAHLTVTYSINTVGFIFFFLPNTKEGSIVYIRYNILWSCNDDKEYLLKLWFNWTLLDFCSHWFWNRFLSLPFPFWMF